MCGICGVMNFSRWHHVERVALEAMNQQIVHRGPDDAGYLCIGKCRLGDASPQHH